MPTKSQRHMDRDCIKIRTFSNTTKLSEILAKAEQQRQFRLPHEAYLKCFDDRGECIPILAYVDLLTIADISFRKIAKIYPENIFLDCPIQIFFLYHFLNLFSYFFMSRHSLQQRLRAVCKPFTLKVCIVIVFPINNPCKFSNIRFPDTLTYSCFFDKSICEICIRNTAKNVLIGTGRRVFSIIPNIWQNRKKVFLHVFVRR